MFVCLCVQLGVPVVKAWLHQGGKLEPISLSSPSAHISAGQADPRLMMIHYTNQYYLQPVQWEGQGVWPALESKTPDQGDHEAVIDVRSH